MPRRIPNSGKKRKEKLLAKRAAKREDDPADESTITARASRTKNFPKPKPGRRGPGRSLMFGDTAERQKASRRLQSSFVKLSAEFLEETKQLACTLPLPRPIPEENGIFTEVLGSSEPLTIMSRPKWNYEMSKKQVENNEEELFKRWIDNTDRKLKDWVNSQNTVPKAANESQDGEELVPEFQTPVEPRMPVAGPSYERNLEVWRQLWRVTEICEILLVLLDSRCPLLHFPKSLQKFLAEFRQPRKLIFVLTKTDITGPSFRERNLPSASGQGKRKQFEPFIPTELRNRLVTALMQAHEELLSPQSVRGEQEKITAGALRVKECIDWSAVINAGEGDVQLGSVPIHGPDADHDDDKDRHFRTTHADFLSVGLIGQPNVGKSSLLNALFGSHKVKASKTPGKTKHFQTLFWTKDIRLVDCPGLVFPDFVTLEQQVLAGIIPISQVSAVPSCLYHASLAIPLERVLRLSHPLNRADNVVEDKRTWRDGMKHEKVAKELSWTAMDVMTSFAESKGWMTAKAGWPDVHRAGNAILRALAEGKIKWAFIPPVSERPIRNAVDGSGIWIEEGHDENWDEALTEEDPYESSEGEGDEDVTSPSNNSQDDDSDPEDEMSTRREGIFAKLSFVEDATDSSEPDEGGRALEGVNA